MLLHPTKSVLLAVSMIALQSLRLSYIVFPSSTVMDARLTQSVNGLVLIVVTLAEMLTSLSAEHLAKASSSILFTLLGIIMDLSVVHPSNAEAPIVVTGASKVITPALVSS